MSKNPKKGKLYQVKAYRVNGMTLDVDNTTLCWKRNFQTEDYTIASQIPIGAWVMFLGSPHDGLSHVLFEDSVIQIRTSKIFAP